MPKELTLDFDAEYVDDMGVISDIVFGLLEETYDCFVRSFQISEVRMTGLKNHIPIRQGTRHANYRPHHIR